MPSAARAGSTMVSALLDTYVLLRDVLLQAGVSRVFRTLWSDSITAELAAAVGDILSVTCVPGAQRAHCRGSSECVFTDARVPVPDPMTGSPWTPAPTIDTPRSFDAPALP